MDWNEIKGVIFDVDGTLIDSMPIWADIGRLYMERIGRASEWRPEENPFPMVLKAAAEYLQQAYQLEESQQEIGETIIQIVREFYCEKVPLKEGVKELLECLAERGILMAVATTSNREMVEAALGRLGILDYFSKVWICSEVGQSKKDGPLVYQVAALEMGLAPQEVLVIEDTLYAVLAAVDGGFRVVAVYDSVSEKDRLQMMELSNCYVERIDEVIPFLV